jgi:hypothetical protein
VPTDQERQTTADRLVQLLSADERIAAVVLVGSAAGGDSATRGYLADLRRGDPALADRLEPPLLSIVSAVRDHRLTP